MKESEIRSIINAYSHEKSGHPFVDYGSKVRITVNDDCPIYECLIQTQYENRSLEVKRIPYRGRTLAPQKYFAVGEVDPWKFNPRVPEDFTDRHTVIEVEGSASVSGCGSCTGKGRTTCSTCDGQGQKVCPECNGEWQHLECRRCGGKGYIGCPDCGGSGNLKCRRCNGTGSITETISEWRTHYDYNLKKEVGKYEDVKKTRSCPDCGGKGSKRCTSCSGRGRISCKSCGGRGEMTCPECTNGKIVCKACSGYGFTVCQVCQGEGRNETRYVIDRVLSQNTLRSYVCDRRVREFAEIHDLNYSDVDFSVRGKVLDEELYPENARCSSRLSKLLAQAEPENGVILFQRAAVQHVVSTYIEYEFEGSSYGGIICDGSFYPNGSPIDDWSSALVDGAEQKLRHGSSAKALRMLEQAESAGADKTATSTLLDRARRKLGSLQDAGVSIGFWFVALCLSPIVFNYYSRLNAVAPWAIVTNNPDWKFYGFLPFCQTLIFLVAALVLRFVLAKSFLTAEDRRHSSIWMYFAKGFFGYILAALGALIVILIVNYLGLSVLTTFILGIVVMAVALVLSLAYLIIRWIIELF